VFTAVAGFVGAMHPEFGEFAFRDRSSSKLAACRWSGLFSTGGLESRFVELEVHDAPSDTGRASRAKLTLAATFGSEPPEHLRCAGSARGGEQLVELSGEVALESDEAADDVFLGELVSGALRELGDRRFVPSHADDHGAVESGVGLSVRAAVRAVTAVGLCPSLRRWDTPHRASRRRLCRGHVRRPLGAGKLRSS